MIKYTVLSLVLVSYLENVLSFKKRGYKKRKVDPEIPLSHITCVDPNNLKYCEGVIRAKVPLSKIRWSQQWEYYNPAVFTSADTSHCKNWSDPDDILSKNFQPNWNFMDGPVNRISYMGYYRISKGYPINPIGRTGLAGRGLLCRWGPNHKVNFIITKWKRMKNLRHVKNKKTWLPILQFLAVLKQGETMWTIPGNLITPGELIPDAINRTFLEDILNPDTFEKKNYRWSTAVSLTKTFYTEGYLIFRGYTDDPFNTDNAWVETVAVQFHRKMHDYADQIPLNPGPNKSVLRWLDADREKSKCMYKQHTDLIKEIVRQMKAHW